jgi:hypothetical protein
MLLTITVDCWHRVKEGRVADILGKQEVRRMNKRRGHISRAFLRLTDWQDNIIERNYVFSGRFNENFVLIAVL